MRIQYFDDGYDPFHATLSIGDEQKDTDPHAEFARLHDSRPVFDEDIRPHFGVPADPTELPRGRPG
ncbi:hypothetical protein [Cupriavidus necator]